MVYVNNSSFSEEQLRTIEILLEIIREKDAFTYSHSKRVSYYSTMVAEILRLSPKDKDILEVGALVHDAGKVFVPTKILAGSLPLTPEERRIINTHPEKGTKLIIFSGISEQVVSCVLHHHERYDGTGYPYGLVGEKIPLLARIVAVADAFDAMTRDRPYAPRLSRHAALDALREGKGTQFDPQVAEAFTAAYYTSNISRTPLMT